MIALFFIVLSGALMASGIDMVFIHPQPVYGNDWMAPAIGAAAGLCVWAILRR